MTNPTQFPGFPAEGLQFLRDLAVNNERAWFEANKQDYQTYLLDPAVAFVTAVGERLKISVSPDIRYDTRTNGSGSLTRIYRDVRFSQDKTPYNTNLNGFFWQGAGKKTESPAFGFRLEADGLGLMAGQFGFPKSVLQKFRDAVADDTLGPELAQIVTDVKAAGDYEVLGEHYKRVPRGYDPDHPRADLLRYAGLYAHPPRIEGAVLTSRAIVDRCVEHFQAMAPIQQWLVKISR